jgi:hypothetical protein
VLKALLEDNEHGALFNLPGMEYRGVASTNLGRLSPEARQSIHVFGNPPLLALFNAATGLPIMLVAQNVEASGHSFNFSPDGRHAIVGRKDGTVSVLDLVEINKQLTKLGLGW